jgi:E3 ubiquitin-protein ligase TRIP12
MKSHAKSNVLLEVEYKEEVGTGLGPTMELYTLISHEFQKSGLDMWRGELLADSRSEWAIPLTWSGCCKSNKDNRIIDIPFSKTFYELILGHVSLVLHL